MNDARFEDAPLADHPLRLRAESAEDLAILSALAQDSVGRAGDIAWMPRKRRLVLVMNRFRWENGTENAQPQRVRSAISVESVLRVRARGLNPKDVGQVFDLLAIQFEPAEGCAGTLNLTLAGGAEIRAEVECLDIALADLSRPWRARATTAPRHVG